MNRIIKYGIVFAISLPIVLLSIPVIVLIIMDAGCPAGTTLHETPKEIDREATERRLAYLESIKLDYLTEEEGELLRAHSHEVGTDKTRFNTREVENVISTFNSTAHMEMDDVTKSQLVDIKRMAYDMPESMERRLEYINSGKIYVLTDADMQEHPWLRDGIKYFERDAKDRDDYWKSGRWFEGENMLHEKAKQRLDELYGHHDDYRPVFEYGDSYYTFGHVVC